MSILADLSLRLRMQSAELTTGLEKAKSSLKDANKASSEFKKGMKGALDEARTGLDRLIPGFSNFTSGIGKAISSVGGLSKSMNVLKVALASTGIGLLVVALGSLAALFTKTDRGADLFSEKLAGLKAVLEVVVQRLALFAEGIIAFLKLDFKGGVDKMTQAFSNLGDEISRAYKEGNNLKRSLNELNNVEAEFILTEAELSNKLKLAREVLNDENSTYEQKQKAIKVAAEAETELYEKQKAILWEKYRITKQQNDILRRNGEDNEDMLKAENEILAEIENLNGDRALAMANIGRMQKRITKEVTKEKEEREAINKIIEEGQSALLQQAKDTEYTVNANFKPMSVEEWAAQYPDVTKDPNYIKSQEAIAQAAAERKKRQEEEAKKDKDHWKEKASNAMEYSSVVTGMLDSISMFQEAAMNRELAAAGDNEAQKEQIRKKYARKQKAISISQAIIGTALAVVNALQTQPFLPMGPIMAGVAGAAGAAQIALIASQPFAQGGIVYGPTMGLVGEYAGARTNPEVIAPLNDLRNILGTTGMTGEVRFVIEQDKLVGILSDYSKKQMYF